MEKNFNEWNALKQKLDHISQPPLFNEREIWWCNVGLNIGSEIYGKGKTFIRPILIIKKFSKNSLLVLPLTTKLKDKFSYYKFSFREKEICVVLSEIRKIDSKRLSDKMGKVPEKEFDGIKKAMKKIIFDPR